MTVSTHDAERVDTSRVDVARPTTRTMLWAGRVMSALPVLFLLFDGAIKIMMIQPVREGMVKLGYPAELAPALGVILIVSVALYAIPATAVLGAILLTGYLGGAVATHVRVGDPLLTHALFPAYVGVLLWGGLYLRNAGLRALFPFRRAAA